MPKAEIDGKTLYYARSGTGPALLLIHGLGSSSRDWEPQIEAFSRRHTVIAPDLRGHGRSSPIAGRVRIRQFANDIAALLQQLDIDDADVVGLSLGGAVAFQLAVDHPRRLRSLTVVNSSPDFVAHSWRERLMVMQRLAMARLLSMKRMGLALSTRLFPDDASLRAQFVARFGANDKRSYLATLDALIGWSVLERLHEIRCPTLVVAADQDYTPVAAKRAYVERLANARLLVIPQSHHAVTAERPQAFNDALAAFLDSLPAAAGAGA